MQCVGRNLTFKFGLDEVTIEMYLQQTSEVTIEMYLQQTSEVTIEMYLQQTSAYKLVNWIVINITLLFTLYCHTTS